MIVKRSADSRGLLNWPWIQSRRTFSNNSYWDPRYMNLGDLKVINDDILAPGATVPEHEHQGYNIYGYVVDGPCDHQDNLGNKTSIPSGAVQRMISGQGIQHTESNNTAEPIRYIQIWFKAKNPKIIPTYGWKEIDRPKNKLVCISDLLPMDSDARLNCAHIEGSIVFEIQPERTYYVYVVKGNGVVNGETYAEGDGFTINDSKFIDFIGENSEVLVIDLK